MNVGKYVLLLFLVICIVSNLTADLRAGDTKSEEFLPPGILPVVILSGSDYEMGYQYGQQVGPYLEKEKEAKWAYFSALQI